ncbi:hypothetical protein BDQ12DRAFT_685831 [Crucibulum laeve]|uniref:Uncharacterized protein n=1 Tax=Crucibulum laeve TaxID=68775 RepID=A0A5C3LWL9_9AGAR|nr:hypothetical protein BDQ12DRAFT_685831 [Crucibulum laeve]
MQTIAAKMSASNPAIKSAFVAINALFWSPDGTNARTWAWTPARNTASMERDLNPSFESSPRFFPSHSSRDRWYSGE